MEISVPNAHCVLSASALENVARHGRAYAAVAIAYCEDGLYRGSAELHYSYGGFASPITRQCPGYVTFAAARLAALDQLLRNCHTPYGSDPDSVRRELAELGRQIEGKLRQPSLF